ncbi:hypothetical protein ABS71_17165 [bacterium SCN 62-11]|nr:response regulator transcription factor [Candidatus Eremiobacteraeota bacterium]ODT60757.1 MAG: hypothetical protein ABS71_17165 [bacterium SCN 62-11]
MILLRLIDDHPVVRQGLKAALESEPDLQVISEAASLSGLPPTQADVTILDLEMEGPEPLAGIASLGAVVIFSAHSEPEKISQALERGALGYVLKGAPLEELIAAIRAASRGETYLQARVAGLLAQALRAPAPRLSPRQTEILRLLADGLSNKEIGVHLGVTERTAKFHVNAIFNRLGADNRAQAVALAGRLGLI